LTRSFYVIEAKWRVVDESSAKALMQIAALTGTSMLQMARELDVKWLADEKGLDRKGRQVIQ
jgi:hypothetical protein